MYLTAQECTRKMKQIELTKYKLLYDLPKYDHQLSILCISFPCLPLN